jgi:hypothetical protein
VKLVMRLLVVPRLRINEGRWADDNTSLRETGWEDVEWLHVVQDRAQWRAHANTVMKFRVP